MQSARAADLDRRLAQAGRTLLGFGDAAIVLALDTRSVLKLGYDGADGWPAWARWCQGQASPHLPRVDFVHTIERQGRAVAFVAVVERLNPTRVAARWLQPDRSLKRDPLRLADLAEGSHPGVAAMLRAAAAAFPAARWDAGPSNWMERDDGTVVLTDPLARSDVRDLASAA